LLRWRLQNTNSAGENGSRRKLSCTSAASASMDLRRSVRRPNRRGARRLRRAWRLLQGTHHGFEQLGIKAGLEVNLDGSDPDGQRGRRFRHGQWEEARTGRCGGRVVELTAIEPVFQLVDADLMTGAPGGHGQADGVIVGDAGGPQLAQLFAVLSGIVHGRQPPWLDQVAFSIA